MNLTITKVLKSYSNEAWKIWWVFHGLQIYQVLEEVDKPWKLKFRSSASSSSSFAQKSQIEIKTPSWQNVTVGWLANAKAFHPQCLPKMKTPDSETGGVYNSPEEYLQVCRDILKCAKKIR